MYTLYHVKWAWMFLTEEVVVELQAVFHGTIFFNWYLRAMGATVGNDVWFVGSALEYDLLHLGDGATVGECVPQAHTVERFVIRNALVTVEMGATMSSGSLVMPGATLGEGTRLHQGALVMKGEATGRGEYWAGNPASSVKRPHHVPPHAAEDTPLLA